MGRVMAYTIIQLRCLLSYKRLAIDLRSELLDELLSLYPPDSPIMDLSVVILQIYIILHNSAALVSSHRKVLQVEIVTLSLVSNSTLSSLHYTYGAFDYGLRTLRNKYGNTINITHTYLFDGRITNCIELTAHAEYMLAEWYYVKRLKSDLRVFLSTCKKNIFL